MEIKDEYIPIAIGIIVIIFLLILAYTNLGIIMTILLITSIITLTYAITKLQKNGRIQKTNVLITSIKNKYAIKRIRNPKMKLVTPQVYEESKQKQNRKKWNIHW